MPERLNLPCMSSKLMSNTVCFYIEDNNDTVDLNMKIRRRAFLGKVYAKLTLPEARKSPLRLKRMHVACPDPVHRKLRTVAFHPLESLELARNLPVRESG